VASFFKKMTVDHLWINEPSHGAVIPAPVASTVKHLPVTLCLIGPTRLCAEAAGEYADSPIISSKPANR
jgi:hypothetical protein